MHGRHQPSGRLLLQFREASKCWFRSFCADDSLSFLTWPVSVFRQSLLNGQAAYEACFDRRSS
jgi:hypothetical protein